MLPQDFAVRMKDMLKEDYDAFLKSYENEKYQALRVNPLKAKDAAVEEKAPFSLTKVRANIRITRRACIISRSRAPWHRQNI